MTEARAIWTQVNNREQILIKQMHINDPSGRVIDLLNNDTALRTDWRVSNRTPVTRGKHGFKNENLL